MAGAGHLIGYLIGTFDVGIVVGRIFGNANNQQFKALTVIASAALLIAVGVTSYSVTERILLLSDATLPKSKADTMIGVLRSLVHRTFNLPPRIQAICWCQFWSWIGWFPFLFYGSTWVGETYYRYEHPTSSTTSSDPKDASHDALDNAGRLGSLALVIFSVITFASSVLLPYVIMSPTSSLSEPGGGKYTPRPLPSLSKAIQSLLLRTGELQPDLVTTWIVSNLVFAGIMAWAPFVRSRAFATILVALAGVPWAISSWAPFAEMGVEINRLASGQPTGNGGSTNIMFPAGGGRNGYTAVRPSMEAELDEDIEMEEARQHRRALPDSVLLLSHDDEEEVHPSTGELAGVYLGVLNVYTTLPQFVGTFVSWIVFTLLEPSKNDGSDDDADHHKWLSVKKNAPNAIAICLFIGACCSVVAAEATRRLKQLD
jgi:solute carrier family 45 protein 1/2/4